MLLWIGLGLLLVSVGLAYYSGMFGSKDDEYTDDCFLQEQQDGSNGEKDESSKEQEKDEGESEKMKIGIFVGSQTGTAQEFAETLESEGSDAGFECTVIDLEEFEPEMFMEYGRLIFCVATYGEGDPCDNANDFDAWVKEEKRDEYFEDVKYTVFGLGNRQYEHYNAQGRFVDKTLESFGAKRMYPYGEGDDDGTLEEDFESWKAKLWTTLRRTELGLESKDTSSKLPKPATLPFVAKTSTIQKQQNGNSRHRRPSADARIGLVSKPYFEIIPLKVVKNVELRQTLELGSTRHVELDIKGTNLASYRTADNLGIIPCNRESSVKSLATHLGYDLDRVFELVPNPDCKKDGKLIFPTPCSVREALSMYCDLHASPSRPFLRTLAAYATGKEQEQLLHLSSQEGIEEYKRTILDPRISLARLIRRFVSLDLPLDVFVQICPRMKERLYTIASSPLNSPNRVHLAVTVVEEKVKDDEIDTFIGLCSGFLDSSRVPDRSGPKPPRSEPKAKWPSIYCFLRESSFKLPRDPKTPVLMFGPGTGIAPMRAILQHREAELKNGVNIGKCILYFGCCKRNVDFLYKDELEKFRSDGVLTELHLAFSRETSKKVYVQHKMKENAKAIWKLVHEEGAWIYVCGGISMGNDVSKTLEIIAQEEGGQNNGKDYVAKMKEGGKYIQELWS